MSQVQTGHLTWRRAIQILHPVDVVVCCYVLVGKLKLVGQSQDVSVDGVPNEVSLISGLKQCIYIVITGVRTYSIRHELKAVLALKPRMEKMGMQE